MMESKAEKVEKVEKTVVWPTFEAQFPVTASETRQMPSSGKRAVRVILLVVLLELIGAAHLLGAF